MKKYEPKDLEAIFKEIEGENPRAAILVCGALVENALEWAIGAHLRKPETDTEKSALFPDNGILGSFSEKIWGAYFMCIIGRTVRHNLDMIRLIRNVAGHDMNPLTFDHPDIASRCGQIELLNEAFKDAPKPSRRQTYVLTAQFLTATLGLRSQENDPDIGEGVKRLPVLKWLDL